MTEFLVSIEIYTGDLPRDEVDRLRAREAVRAAELNEAGHLVRLWRVPGRWANRGIWRASSEQELIEILASLPLRPYMKLGFEPLDPHPSDPQFVVGREPAPRVPLTPLPDLSVRGRHPSGPALELRPGTPVIALDSLPDLRARGRAADDGGSGPQLPAAPQVANDGRITTVIDVEGSEGWAAASADDRDELLLAAISSVVNDLAVASGLTRFEGGSQEGQVCKVTHAGDSGILSMVVPDDGVTVDVGSVRRRPVVVDDATVGEVLTTRSVARLTVSVPASEGVDRAVRFTTALAQAALFHSAG